MTSRMCGDRPLTDAQERNLIALVKQQDGFRDGKRTREWIRPGQYGTRANTLGSLKRLGLAEDRFSPGLYRPTDEGRKLCDSMGDRP
jgi:hypothetical protein